MNMRGIYFFPMESNISNYELVRCLLNVACLSASHFPYADKLHLLILFDIFIPRGNADMHDTISPVVCVFVFFCISTTMFCFIMHMFFTHIRTCVRTHIYIYSHLHIHMYRETLEHMYNIYNIYKQSFIRSSVITLINQI